MKRIAILLITVALFSTIARADTQVLEKPSYLLKITISDAFNGNDVLSGTIITLRCHTCSKEILIEETDEELYYLIKANSVTLRHIGHTVEVRLNRSDYMPGDYLIESFSTTPMEIKARLYPHSKEGLLEWMKNRKQPK
ncbi:MAG TPA: hypothetical protein VMX79_08885 [bacterium]|nr:hypothetical protein [bacterium]